MRAFIAIELPAAIQAALGRKQSAFNAGCPECRWTRPQGIHLTLKFLGHVADDQVKNVTEALAALGQFEKFPVEVRGFGFFPSARRPRVFWAGVDAPTALAELVRRVEAAMQKLSFPPEERPFTPHLTMARFKNPRPQPALEALLQQEAASTLGRFEASEFFLFESKLSPHGAEYRKVARFPEA